MTDLEITMATGDDLTALQSLYVHLIKNDVPCPPDVAQDAIATLSLYPGSGVLIARHKGTPVASCTLIIIPNFSRGGQPYALIENVVTHTNYRARGCGKALLDTASARAWDRGCYKVMLMTGAKDEGVLTFYEKAGFAQSKTGFQKRRLAPR
ncbi:MAG: GNAT family N-acetyltransferase [Yoonia sp.]|uniref:GNAT family N-acetyltransferase n=1 Tax=Yoonia sp. TaxID=2212373 RepID=UPI00326780C1